VEFVVFHLGNIFRKRGISSRTELADPAIRPVRA